MCSAAETPLNRGRRLTFKAPDEDAQRIQLPPIPHPRMQRRADSPKKHTTRHPKHHAIPPPQRRTKRLQRNEESEEQRNSRIQRALVESNIRREMRRLCISNLFPISKPSHCQSLRIRAFDLSSALNRNSSARNGNSKRSSFLSVLLCNRASTAHVSSSSSGGIVVVSCSVAERDVAAVSSYSWCSWSAILSGAKSEPTRMHHRVCDFG